MTQLTSTPYADATIDDAGIATLTVTNSKPLNIVGTPAIAELTDALKERRKNDDVRVLVFRGSGDKAFIGGADIYEMSELDQSPASSSSRGCGTFALRCMTSRRPSSRGCPGTRSVVVLRSRWRRTSG